MILGLIAEYEEREAAIFAGFDWDTWCKRPVQERSLSVAHMRVHYLLGSHVREAVDLESERRSKAQKSRAS